MAVIEAEPYAFDFDLARAGLVIIDMQRDFLEPGGFGAALGNDVSLLRRTIAPTRSLLEEGPSSIPARAIVLTSPICRPRRNPVVGPPPASVTRVRWAASWCAASPATTSSPNSTRYWENQ